MALCGCNHRFVTVSSDKKVMATSETAKEKEMIKVCTYVRNQSSTSVYIIIRTSPTSMIRALVKSKMICYHLYQELMESKGFNGLLMHKLLEIF